MASMALRSVIIATAALSAGAVRVTPTTAKAALVAAEPAKVSPPLDPESSKKFFNKDYPHDEQPKTAAQGVKNIGKEVYPKMQETDTFHSDLVKDENGDGGKWETQMAYDIARHKLTKESSEMDKAKAIADAKETKAKAAEAKAAAAKEKAEAAKAEAAEAKAAKAKAEEEAGAEANGKKSEMSKEEAEMRAKVEAAEAEYLKEKAQFKNCQQELEDAKTKYEALKAEKENLVKTDTAQAKLLKIDHTMIDQEKTREDVALAKLAKAEKERDVAEAEAAKVRAENEKAMKALAKEQADVQAVQSQLDEADAKLRGGPKVKGLGNMGKKSKSAASARTLSQTVMLVVASAALKQLF